MRLLVSLLVWGRHAVLTSRRSLALENLALRQQLATCAQAQKRPWLKQGESAFRVALSKVWREWRSHFRPSPIPAEHLNLHPKP